tara:strand:+ start:73 stop:1359 length:1287 start_codon:yes stop_codon:yes gene_type:complete
MSIIKAMRMVEDFTDEMLEQAVRGLGNISVPSYVALSEMLRRTNLRNSAKALQDTPQGTVADRKIQEARGSMSQNVMNNNTEMSATMPRQGFQEGRVASLSDFLSQFVKDEDEESELRRIADSYFANRPSRPSLRRSEEDIDRRLDVAALSGLASAISEPNLGKAAKSLAGSAERVGGLRDRLETQDRLAAAAEVDQLDKEFMQRFNVQKDIDTMGRLDFASELQLGQLYNEDQKNQILAEANRLQAQDRQIKLVLDAYKMSQQEIAKAKANAAFDPDALARIVEEENRIFKTLEELTGMQFTVDDIAKSDAPTGGETLADQAEQALAGFTGTDTPAPAPAPDAADDPVLTGDTEDATEMGPGGLVPRQNIFQMLSDIKRNKQIKILKQYVGPGYRNTARVKQILRSLGLDVNSSKSQIQAYLNSIGE